MPPQELPETYIPGFSSHGHIISYKVMKNSVSRVSSAELWGKSTLLLNHVNHCWNNGIHQPKGKAGINVSLVNGYATSDTFTRRLTLQSLNGYYICFHSIMNPQGQTCAHMIARGVYVSQTIPTRGLSTLRNSKTRKLTLSSRWIGMPHSGPMNTS